MRARRRISKRRAIELAPLADAALIPRTSMTVLDMHEQAGRTPTETLTDQLRPRELLLALTEGEVGVASLVKSVLVVNSTAETVDFGGAQQVVDLRGHPALEEHRLAALPQRLEQADDEQPQLAELLVLGELQQRARRIHRDDAEPGDILLFQYRADMPMHFAVLIYNNYVVHAHGSTGKVVKHRLSPAWAMRLHSIWRAEGVDG